MVLCATLISISPCTHEEADTRILLHAVECAMQGFNTVVIRTVDMDVMIIAISMFQHLGLSELWIAFGTGKNFHYVPIHDIVKDGTNKGTVSNSVPCLHMV